MHSFFSHLPDETFFGTSQFSQKELCEFRRWYAWKKAQGEYALGEELEKYCANDVFVLHQGCAILRQEIIDLVGMDPFYVSVSSIVGIYFLHLIIIIR